MASSDFVLNNSSLTLSIWITSDCYCLFTNLWEAYPSGSSWSCCQPIFTASREGFLPIMPAVRPGHLSTYIDPSMENLERPLAAFWLVRVLEKSCQIPLPIKKDLVLIISMYKMGRASGKLKTRQKRFIFRLALIQPCKKITFRHLVRLSP